MRPTRSAAKASTRAAERAAREGSGTSRSLPAMSTATATPERRCWPRPARSVSLMDCDTTGIEADFSLVKFKELVGGGNMTIVNKSVPLALRTLE